MVNLDEDDYNPDVKIHERSKTLIFCRVPKWRDFQKKSMTSSTGSCTAVAKMAVTETGRAYEYAENGLSKR